MPRLDIHTHLAGIGSEGSGCAVSSRMRRTLTYHGMRRLTGVHRPEARGREDAAYVEVLARTVDEARELDYACVFAMDGVYDAHGELVRDQSHLIVPNAHAMAACRAHRKLLPVISVNPDRKDAVEELERWGPSAVALKWLGPLQKFQLDAVRHAKVIAAIKELDLVVIAHTGCEHTFPGMDQRLGNPALYEPLLKKGIPVVFSHCGTGTFLHPGYDYTHEFIRMLDLYDHAYGDTSAFCTLVRFKRVRQFRVEKYVGRLVHGSDFPIPGLSVYFLPDLGFNRVVQLQGIRNPLDRDVLTKRAMGLPDSTLTAAGRILESGLARWQRSRQA
jgi:predicted TIM-barrel fold metal-dependent hydrolase